MAKHRDSNEGVDLDGRDDFVQQNAVALIEQRDTKIHRLRERVRVLEKSNHSRKADAKGSRQRITELEAQLEAADKRADVAEKNLELVRGQIPEPESVESVAKRCSKIIELNEKNQQLTADTAAMLEAGKLIREFYGHASCGICKGGIPYGKDRGVEHKEHCPFYVFQADHPGTRWLERLKKLEAYKANLMKCPDCSGWFTFPDLLPSSPDPQCSPICRSCVERAADKARLEELSNDLEVVTEYCHDLECVCTSQAERLEAAEKKWKSIESAPKDGTEILLRVERRAGIPGKCLVGHYMSGGHCIEDHPAIDEGWYFWNGCMFDKASKPFQWMELLPSEQERYATTKTTDKAKEPTDA